MTHKAEIPTPPMAAYRLVRELWESEAEIDERRAAQRFPVAATLRIVPLDDAMQPCGEPFLSVLRDISERGISFVHTRAVTQGYYFVEFDVPNVPTPSLLVHFVRCEPVRLFYLIAARIISKRASLQSE